jgi:hypothetical protein
MPSPDADFRIYRYRDGSPPGADGSPGTARADPAVLDRALMKAARDLTGGSWGALYEAWREARGHYFERLGSPAGPRPAPADGTPPEPTTDDVAEVMATLEGRLVAVIREAFHVRAFDPSAADGDHGLTEEETLAVLADYYGWLEKKGRSTGAGPGGSGSTAGDPPVSSNPCSGGPSTTSSTSASS